jgi:NAD(P)-dependent dehydrogenase (short-subunit alcohol dehydrogenase family)
MSVPTVRELLDFSGKVVVVTGAGSGLGTGLARRFAEAGAAVVVHYNTSEAGARAAAKEIADRSGRAVAVQADVSTGAGAEKLLQETVQEFSALDVVVNNAGGYPVAPLLEMSEEEFDRVLAANLRSVHLMTQAAARWWSEQKRGGAIINIASISAWQPGLGHAHYNAAKAAVAMHTRTAAAELGRLGIRVNAVSPGVIWREGIEQAWPEGVARYLKVVPLSRLGLPEDVADACLFLASEAARWVTGANLVVDGGVLACNVY